MIDIRIVVVLVCTLLRFVVSGILQSEGEKFLSKCISLKAGVLISHLALKRQAGLKELGDR